MKTPMQRSDVVRLWQKAHSAVQEHGVLLCMLQQVPRSACIYYRSVKNISRPAVD